MPTNESEFPQVTHDLRTGEIRVEQIPPPLVKPHHVVVRNDFSVISSGTERSLLAFGQSSLIDKAKAQPEKLQQLRQKIRSQGLLEAYQAVSTKLDDPIPMGYSSSGVIVSVGDGVEGLSVGDRVCSNAPHAGIALVSQNLVAKIPESVSSEQACFGAVGAIALQSVRLAGTAVGESVAVVGLGLVGLIICQILISSGCRVIAIDTDESRVKIARSYGALGMVSDDKGALVEEVERTLGGLGADAVIIATSGKSDQVLSLSASIARKRAQIVLVGTAGLEVKREDFYSKELTLRVSTSYGPGRYDADYESGKNSFPLAYVRWTAKRNFEAFLFLLSTGAVQTESLVSEVYEIRNASDAYQKLMQDPSVLTLLLRFPAQEGSRQNPVDEVKTRLPSGGVTGEGELQKIQPRVSLIGPGHYARSTLLPVLRRTSAQLVAVISENGLSASRARAKYGFTIASSDFDRTLASAPCDALFVSSRHDSHAAYARRSLEQGISVYVEKPLALTVEELDSVESAYWQAVAHFPGIRLAVGYNRRFAPMVQEMKRLSQGIDAPKFVTMTINAGKLREDHWLMNPRLGGGKILGEASHFIDLAHFLIGHTVSDWWAERLGDGPAQSATIGLKFSDGSLVTINYVSESSRSMPKERIELATIGRSIVLHNYRKLSAHGWPTSRQRYTIRADKGHKRAVAHFLNCVTTGKPFLVRPQEIFDISRLSIEISDSLRGSSK